MHSHKEKVNNYKEYYELTTAQAEKALKLFTHLRRGYSSEVVNMASKKGIEATSQEVRHVKMGYRKNPILFNMLVHLAQIEKANGVAAREKLEV